MTPSSVRSQKGDLPFSRSIAFIIGIDNYEQLTSLGTAVNDAEQLAELLQEKHHFEIGALLVNASARELTELLENTLPTSVTAKDRVFFYFAGHGVAVDGEDGPAGYVIPADATHGDADTYIAMDKIQAALHQLPCKHLMLILDCCFSGAFQWSSRFRAGGLPPKRLYKERFDRFVREPAWQVLTSAASDQKALDALAGQTVGQRGTIIKSKRKEYEEWQKRPHSPFALALFEGLVGDADINPPSRQGDGVITATELYAYIRDRLEPATEKKDHEQTPRIFPLPKHGKGEYIFLHPNHRLNLPPTPDKSPYKGLKPFEEADGDLFYGRGKIVKDILNQLQEKPLVVISGDSASGKSSLVKAGLFPALREQNYQILPVIQPGEHLLTALASAFPAHDNAIMGTDDSPEAIAAALLHGISGKKNILLIDQFEEVYTHCQTPAERKQFSDILKALLEISTANEMSIIITVRADFAEHLKDTSLAGFLDDAYYHIPRFSLEELHQIVLMPTEQEVMIFDPPEMVETIIGKVHHSPGALTLTARILRDLYEKYRSGGRRDRALKLEDYENIGGVFGALAKQADQLYAALPPEEQHTMRKIILRMVEKAGDGVEYRRVSRDELIYIDEQETVRAKKIIAKMNANALIVCGNGYIEPVHHDLLTAWSTAKEWISENAAEMALQNELTADVNKPKALEEGFKLWVDHPKLDLMAKQLADPENLFNAREQAFINMSLGLRAQERFRSQEAAAEKRRLEDEVNQVQHQMVNEVIEASWKTGTLLQPTENTGTEGSRQVYSQLKVLLDIKKVQLLSGMKVFVNGPHQGDMNFAANSFGYYNPEFLSWAKDRMIPAMNNEPLRRLTQPFYNNFLQDMSKIYYLTYQQLTYNQAMKERIKAEYLQAVAQGFPGYYSGGMFFERHFGLWEKNAELEQLTGIHRVGPYWYWVVSLGFWIRRDIDGTSDDFIEILENLLRTYDSDWLSNPPQLPAYYS